MWGQQTDCICFLPIPASILVTVSPDNQFWKFRLKQNPISYFSPSIALQTLQTCLWPYIQTWKRLCQKALGIYPLMYFFKIMQLAFYDFVQCALWKQISYIVTVEYTRWAPEMEIVWVFFRRIFCFESFWEFFYPINLNFISILYKFLYFDHFTNKWFLFLIDRSTASITLQKKCKRNVSLWNKFLYWCLFLLPCMESSRWYVLDFSTTSKFFLSKEVGMDLDQSLTCS